MAAAEGDDIFGKLGAALTVLVLELYLRGLSTFFYTLFCSGHQWIA
jgi:hypothetical protein